MRKRRLLRMRGALQSVLALSTVAFGNTETPYTTTIGTETISQSAQNRLQNVIVECRADSMCLDGLSHHDLQLARSSSTVGGTATDTCLTRHHRKLCTTGLTGCGIQLAVNGTHQVYTSEISLHDELVRWQCIYPLESSPQSQVQKTANNYSSNLSRPLLPTMKRKASEKLSDGAGSFLMSFLLYDDPDYTRPMRTNPNLDKDGLIRARVFLLDHHVKSATVQLSRCWATPFADPKVEPFDLIDNFCPVGNTGAQVNVVNTGSAHYATFESGLFKFENSGSVHLHCNVRVCFSNLKDCQIDCSASGMRRRKRRSIDDSNDTTISLGPISIDEAPLHIMEFSKLRNTEVLDLEDTSIRLPPGVLWTMILTLILCASALTLILIKWLLDESNQDKSKIMSRSRAESIISDSIPPGVPNPDERFQENNHVVKV